MKIVVCIKQVPDTAEVKIDPATNNLVRDGVPSIMNPYDRCALTSAIKIKKEAGSQVAVISMGPPQAKTMLEEAVLMGADEAFLVTGKEFAGADTLATGYALSSMIRKMHADLVFCGNEAIDGCTGQVGPVIAENLGWPQITYVASLQIENDFVKAVRETHDSYHVLNVKLPAVICVLKKTEAEKIEPSNTAPTDGKIHIISAADIGLDVSMVGSSGSPTKVKSIKVNNQRPQRYVQIDSNLPAEERIRMIINGGIVPKKIALTRGSPASLAKVIFDDADFRKHFAG